LLITIINIYYKLSQNGNYLTQNSRGLKQNQNGHGRHGRHAKFQGPLFAALATSLTAEYQQYFERGGAQKRAANNALGERGSPRGIADESKRY
jgi:hypothetical protein